MTSPSKRVELIVVALAERKEGRASIKEFIGHERDGVCYVCRDGWALHWDKGREFDAAWKAERLQW